MPMGRDQSRPYDRRAFITRMQPAGDGVAPMPPARLVYTALCELTVEALGEDMLESRVGTLLARGRREVQRST
jgi:hypothetical protein